SAKAAACARENRRAGTAAPRAMMRATAASDRRCFGHALEIGEIGRPILWTNDATGIRYELVPGAIRERRGVTCREFTMGAADARGRSSNSGLACQVQPGVWRRVGDRQPRQRQANLRRRLCRIVAERENSLVR